MLLEVDHGWVLQMPEGIGDVYNRVWLMPGGVVDSSDPYIAHAIRGQRHKFKQARSDAKASEVPSVLVNDRAQWMTKAAAVPKMESKKAEALKTAAATGSTSNIELPNIGKKK